MFWRSSSESAFCCSRYFDIAASASVTFFSCLATSSVSQTRFLLIVSRRRSRFCCAYSSASVVAASAANSGLGDDVDDFDQPRRLFGNDLDTAEELADERSSQPRFRRRAGFSAGTSGFRPRDDICARTCRSPCRASRTALERAAALRRAAVEERMVLQLQPLRRRAWPGRGCGECCTACCSTGSESCQNIGSFELRLPTAVDAFVLNLDACAGAIEGNLRVGLQHHQADDDDEGCAGDPAVAEDRGQPIQQVNLLSTRRLARTRGGLGGPGGLLKILDVEHGCPVSGY